EFEPGLRGRARFLQIVIDAPCGSSEPPEAVKGIANVAAEINTRQGTEAWRPVELRMESLTREDLVVVYRAADVMVAAPISDMTPFAHEFVASRADGSGALVLGRGTGPATPPRGAVIVDGDDEFAVFLGLRHAAKMTRGEEERRMRRLRSCVTAHDVVAWPRGRLESLASATASAAPVHLPRD
ncbi:MAG TPA: trehalose-6-phosphate synthase, partial [Gemmatimonadaceae bacterium]